MLPNLQKSGINNEQKVYLNIRKSIILSTLKPILYKIKGINNSTNSFVKLVIKLNKLYFFKFDMFYSTSARDVINSNSSYVHLISILVIFIPSILIVVASSLFPKFSKSFVTFSIRDFSTSKVKLVL